MLCCLISAGNSGTPNVSVWKQLIELSKDQVMIPNPQQLAKQKVQIIFLICHVKCTKKQSKPHLHGHFLDLSTMDRGSKQSGESDGGTVILDILEILVEF